MENNKTQELTAEQKLAQEAGNAALSFLRGEFPNNNASNFLNEAVKNALFTAFCAGYQAAVKARDTKPKLILQ